MGLVNIKDDDGLFAAMGTEFMFVFIIIFYRFFFNGVRASSSRFCCYFFVAVVSFLLLLVVVGGEDEKGKQCQGIGSSWSVCGIVVGRR